MFSLSLATLQPPVQIQNTVLQLVQHNTVHVSRGRFMQYVTFASHCQQGVVSVFGFVQLDAACASSKYCSVCQ